MTVHADEASTIREVLKQTLPEYTPTSVQPTPIPNLFQVEIGPQIMFMTGDGHYMIDGAIIDLQTKQDIAESARQAAKRRAVEALASQSIHFDAPEPKHWITVFTDIDCGYCRQLHQQIDGYNAAGISVRYLFYPRSGVDSPSYNKAVSVWCAKDQKAAMTAAKKGQPIANATCDNPIRKHMELGELMGIRGTPAIVLDTGMLIPGYVPPDRLVQLFTATESQAK
jgi:thiol:disulfide interchange protein DsbC